jgi:hypothetical protein
MVFLHFGLTFLFLHWSVGLTSAKTRKGDDDGGGEGDMLWQIQLFRDGLTSFPQNDFKLNSMFFTMSIPRSLDFYNHVVFKEIFKKSFMVFMQA